MSNMFCSFVLKGRRKFVVEKISQIHIYVYIYMYKNDDSIISNSFSMTNSQIPELKKIMKGVSQEEQEKMRTVMRQVGQRLVSFP